ncbi:MAG: M23 family metallopeptidase [Bacteroidales bacterium]|nr:M23 family metallopeptidase [Bacteroidales bacterium]
MLKILVFTFFMAMGFSYGDDSGEKSLPLNVKPSFAGTYGELRSGRFHAGLDFRVGGVVGEPIYVIDHGYISRITVSSTGYGNGLYVTHPDGTTSIYGHMHEFAPEIALMVERRQYETESFNVNMTLDQDAFPVEKGQYLGTVGNSGSSAAPHLHFEVRNPDGSAPVNVIAAGYFEHKDDVPPVIQKINFYSYEDSTGLVQSELIKSFKGSSSKPFSVSDKFYVAVDAHDRQSGTPGKLGVEAFEFFLDGESVYRFELGEYTYKEQETFNSLIDYRELVRSRSVMVKSLVEPGNGFRNKITSSNQGVFLLEDNEVHSVKVVVEDLSGNKKIANFKVKRGRCAAKDTMVYDRAIPWFVPYAYAKDGVKVSLPVMSLFRSEAIRIDTLDVRGEFYSKVWQVHTPEVPINGTGSIELAVRNLPQELESKAFLGYLLPEGDILYCGGKYSDGVMRGRLSSFGAYCVSVDTIAPVIKTRFSSERQIVRSGQMAFTIKDDLSGIAGFRAEIDGEWVLAQYDRKFNKLWIVLDAERVSRGCKHELVLSVEDNKNNISTFKYKFKW